MTNRKRIPIQLAFLACFGFCIPSSFLDAAPPQSAATPDATIVDIALGAGGMLSGRILNGNGQPVPNTTLSLQSHQRTLAKATSGKDGSFRFSAMRGGIYQIQAEGHTMTARVWAENTAPPHALANATLVTGTVVRGQGCTEDSCTGACGGTCAAGKAPLAFLLNPVVIGAAVAAAVAIPLATDDDDDDTAPAS